MINFGLIGAGRIGQVHARSLAAHPNARLVAIADPVIEAAEKLAKSYDARAVADAEELFQADDIDAVIIGSPTPLHVAHITAAVKAGKAALCEKPIAMSSADEEKLMKAIEGYDAKVMLGFNRRFAPAFAAVRKAVSDGKIGGEIEQLTIISRDPAAPPKEYIAVSGGIFKDMTIHDFDTAQFMLGPIKTVQAVGQNLDPELADTGDFDAAVITLIAESGAVATIPNPRHCSSGYDQRLEAFGKDGALFAENIRPTTVRFSNNQVTDAQDVYLDFFLDRYADAYALELGHFIDALEAGEEISPSIADGFAALRIAEAAEESAHDGSKPIHL